MPVTPRTCPSTRWSRVNSWSLEALYPGWLAIPPAHYTLVRYMSQADGQRHRHDLGRDRAVAADGLRGLVGAGAGLRDLGDRPGLGAEAASRGRARGLGPEAGGVGDRSRRRLLLVLLRRDRDRQVAVPEGGVGRHRPRLPVRLDEPGLGARPRALGPDRLAVHDRRVPRRDRDDRPDGPPAAGVRL